MNTSFLRLAFTLWLAFLLPTCPASAAAPIIQAPAGPIVGVRQGDVVSYKGIPYARPPVGPLRWHDPMPAPKWKTTLRADYFQAECMQKPFLYDAAPLRTKPSEDCLYLNVWTPVAAAAGKRPVMVWIHGGGFVNGGSSPAMFDGGAFARSGVVFVSLNYRLGRFGSFAFPGLTGENGHTPAANFGLLDQIAALKWIKQNVASFGGDPNNITLMGESAGGMSVHLLVMSQEARGLFGKAIIESGGGRELLGGMESLSQAETVAADFAHRQGIDPAAPDALEKLRALPPEAVIDDLNLATLLDRSDFSGPIIDGTLIRSQVDTAYDSDEVAHIPMLIGTNDADGIFGGDLVAAYAPVRTHRAQAEAIYDPDGKRDAGRIGTAIWADMMMIEPARHISRVVSALGEPVYAYRFAYVASYLRPSQSGASHASEITFAFDTVGTVFGAKTSAYDLHEAQLMHDYWVSFAKTGRPEISGHPAWAPFDPVKDRLMLFDFTGAAMKADPYRTRQDFIENVRASGDGAR